MAREVLKIDMPGHLARRLRRDGKILKGRCQLVEGVAPPSDHDGVSTCTQLDRSPTFGEYPNGAKRGGLYDTLGRWHQSDFSRRSVADDTRELPECVRGTVECDTVGSEDVPGAVDFRRRSGCDGQAVTSIVSFLLGVRAATG